MNTFNKYKERTMTSCLVQQLFRQRIGQELDPRLVDEVLFPMLRSRKHPSKDLLLDIKLTQSCNGNGHSAIVQIFYGGTIRNTSLFGVGQRGGEEDAVQASQLVAVRATHLSYPTTSAYMLAAKRLRYGKNTSKLRRHTSYHTSWGSVDILNELRESKTRYMIQFEKEGTGMSISLEEEPLSATRSPALVPKPKLENELLNEFIEQSLLPGKRLSWGGDPDRLFVPILSTCY
jgi:hypothetical protein